MVKKAIICRLSLAYLPNLVGPARQQPDFFVKIMNINHK